MSPTKKSEHTRTRLLAAATDALIEGHGEFEMTQLAHKAGVSTGLAYHHFGSKAGVVAAVVDDFYRRWTALTTQRPDVEEPWATGERRRHDATVAFLYADPLAPVLLGHMSRNAEVASIEERHLDSLTRIARQTIEAGQAQGEIALELDAGIAAAAMIGAVIHATARALAASPRLDRHTLAEQLWALIAGGLRLEIVN